MQVLGILLLLLASAGPSFSLRPADCEAAASKAGEILNLINERRNEGYVFQLLRVADAHTDGHVHTDGHEKESEIIHYLVLDVMESECPVLSRTHWEDCHPEIGRKPFEIVIGKCKVVAISHPNTSCEQEHLDKVIDFNCTTSSVSSALTNRRPVPVIIDYFEDREQFRGLAERALKQYQESDASISSFQVFKVERAHRARGGERTNLYLEFSIRSHSAQEAGSPPTSRRFSRSCPVYGFCKATLVYNLENSDLNNPEDFLVSCEIFNVEDSRNFSSGRHHHRHHFHSPSRGHSKHRHSGHGCQDSPHHHQSHEHREPHHTDHSSLEEKEPKVGPEKRLLSSPDTFPVRDESELHHPQGTHPPLEHDESHDHHMQDPHQSCPHGHNPQKHPHGHGSHGHGSHGHGSHGHHSHDHGSHGHGSHGHGSHGHGSRDHGPHRHGPHSHGPCRHGPPPGHSERQDFHRGFPFHWREPGVVYQLPPLKKGEVLPLPEISIPSKDHCPHTGSKHHPKIEIQPFPQTSSESCPGKFQVDYPQVLPFLEHKATK
ncbi:histidine-rich glycoprotein [Macrotis lagotis]|uniref:histidine-rich glycoprotein n=1 Tax=Macrotis lagotis TaxID=92651 RepID=UPI003D68241D